MLTNFPAYGGGPQYSLPTISYTLFAENHRLYKVNVEGLCECLKDINKRMRSTRWNPEEYRLYEWVLNSSLCLLTEDNENTLLHETLKSELRQFLPKVFAMRFEVNMIPQNILETAEKIQVTLDNKNTNSQETRINPHDLPSLHASQDIFQQLKQRELHSSFCLEKMREQCFVENINERNFKEIILPTIGDIGKDAHIDKFDVQGHVTALLIGIHVIIFDFEIKKTLMQIKSESKNVQWHNVKIIENCVLIEEDDKIRIFDFIEQNEKKSIDLGQYFDCFIKDNQIFCLLKDGKLQQWDLNGNLVQTIIGQPVTLSKPPMPNKSGIQTLVSENFLVHFFYHYGCLEIVIYDLQKQTQKKVELKPGHIDIHLDLSNALIEDNRLICGLASKNTHLPSFCVIDLNSGEITNQIEELS
jgi:hypothetical protein